MRETRRGVLRATAGAVGAVGAAGTATAQEGGEMRPDWDGFLDGIDGGYEDLRGESDVTISVGAQGNGGAFAFAPAGVWIDPGTTVRWEWTGEGGGHNVIADDGPASLDSGDAVDTTGVEYEYTFEEGDAGITGYFCDPHRSLGMLGAVAVGDDVPTVQAGGAGGGGGGGDAVWQPPGDTLTVTLVGMVLGSIALGILSVLGAEWYTSRKERQERALEAAEAAPGEAVPAEEAPVEEPTVEISHDEFDPVGTATLVALYFLILVLMWTFVYFVEFLGNGPTIIG